MTSQNDAILAALKRGPITPAGAVTIGCYRLAARIRDLREQGHDIRTELITNRNGGRHARYYLAKEHGNGERHQ